MSDLNCQAVCNSEGCFHNLSIMFPRSMADYNAFEAMDLHSKLQIKMLNSLLALFGENVYINCEFMATPYSGGNLLLLQDAYGLYQLQLKIVVKCVLEMYFTFCYSKATDFEKDWANIKPYLC